MTGLLQRLRQRKLVQWGLAYLAAAWILLQVLDMVGQKFAWPDLAGRVLIIAACIGFFVVLVLAWYHGDQGRQRVSGAELLLIALVLAIGGGLLWRFAATTSSATTTKPVAATTNSPAQAIPPKSIAVLPFTNLSSDKQNEYFVAGMQDLILGKLADIGDLKVISRTSTMKYESKPENLRQVAAELGVAHILEGSVQKAGNTVLINVQLIDARTDNHLWAESYKRTLDDIFGVEGEVAGKIADSLQARLSPAETSRLAVVPTKNPAAYDAFLQAEYLVNRGNLEFTSDWYRKAIPYYEQALRDDPGFVLALARLSFAESFAYWFGGRDDQALADKARLHAQQALDRQPDLADAQVAMGYAQYAGADAYQAALEDFSAALALRPHDPEILMAEAFALRRLGRLPAAIAAFQEAVSLNPRSSYAFESLGETLLMAHRFDEAEVALQRARSIDPGNTVALEQLASKAVLAQGDVSRALTLLVGDQPRLIARRLGFLQMQGRYTDAIHMLESLPPNAREFGTNGDRELIQADLLRLSGKFDGARKLYASALPQIHAQLDNLRSNRDQSAAWTQIARALHGLGKEREALDALSRSQDLARRSGDLIEYPHLAAANASVYADMRHPDLAIPLLREILPGDKGGMYFSPTMLWADSSWNPIRNDPGFQALLKQYARFKPAGGDAGSGND
ncbi:MAG: tetratricopeptide repeat protein [Lysobacterales bacterium]